MRFFSMQVYDMLRFSDIIHYFYLLFKIVLISHYFDPK